ncbi:sensor histidine kinase [Capnocytophaga catalasegens]|uniref:Signal transduction histidine kinase internal region domain-containing protein n=1 Tax=Capnocytophaga catalasegens TaxID=1004260 RepID=A0AAV5AZU7_9FLAO|nr:histidine kinase [Capnocytophaga catalasegens]GIZ15345.1 hypothetical protein RCZ03_13450 [Capnocytophaga catalasegens]GJM50512.1 hypothetical protein RCZ15_14850 [Capnocytophaga catalasegens]GJM52116.1 hypothetical protein RCZ16_04340 [Capnocytophaga catalasegens]
MFFPFRYRKLFWVITIILMDSTLFSQSNGERFFLPKNDDYYLNFILATDTLIPQKKQIVVSVFIKKEFATLTDKEHFAPYNFLKIRDLRNRNLLDSIPYYLDKIHLKEQQTEFYFLKILENLRVETSKKNSISHDIIAKTLKIIESADEKNSKVTYKFFEELAKFCFINKNYEKAQVYSQIYFDKNIFNKSKVVQQRFYDIQCLIAIAKNDSTNLKKYMNKAIDLAKKNNDKEALIRAKEFESQYNILTNNQKESLIQTQESYHFFKKKERLEPSMANNLAYTFLKNNKLDSAIYYFKEAIILSRQNTNNQENTNNYLKGLSETYALQKDYQNAYNSLKTAYSLEKEQEEKLQAQKIDSLLIQYETKKKEQEIKILRLNNELNNKTIFQQKIIFFGAFLFISLLSIGVYILYNRKFLNEKNEKLQIENARLLLEQKTRQMQLNPHFIYNAIANLQGLISQEEKIEANRYLVKLSNFIRKILEINRQEYISLNEEIEILENYLQLQQIRFSDSFDYEFITDLDPETCIIPPMLIQPFIENSVEHGFKNLPYKGHLQIHFYSEDNKLKINIRDNGWGIQTPKNVTKKSLSKIIIQERLDLLFNHNGKKLAYFISQPIEENEKTGYIVTIYLPLILEK